MFLSLGAACTDLPEPQPCPGGAPGRGSPAPLSRFVSEQVPFPPSLPPGSAEHRNPREQSGQEHPRASTARTHGTRRGIHPGPPRAGVPGAPGSENPSRAALPAPLSLPALPAPGKKSKTSSKVAQGKRRPEKAASGSEERGAAAPWQGWESSSKPCGQHNGARSHQSPLPSTHQTALKPLLQQNYTQL